MTRKTKLHLVGQDPADIFDDLDKLKADSTAPVQQALKGWRRYSTTVPREWELRLQRATRISTYRLAHELLYQKWFAEQGNYGRKGEPVIVSSEVVKLAGLSTRSMDNALSELKRLGLIEVVRAQGRAPRASLLHVPAKTPRRRA
jgi:hypothetical protein